MQLQKFRWSKVYESSEEELVQLLEAQDIKAERWQAEEFHDFGGQSFQQDTTIWCADGSLTMTFAEKKFSMQPGDGLWIPANYAFNAVAGMSGCTCYEYSGPH
jgi:mannose-6-phosphate isomerase class I